MTLSGYGGTDGIKSLHKLPLYFKVREYTDPGYYSYSLCRTKWKT